MAYKLLVEEHSQCPIIIKDLQDQIRKLEERIRLLSGSKIEEGRIAFDRSSKQVTEEVSEIVDVAQNKRSQFALGSSINTST